MAYGLAKNNRFMLSTASLLLGAQADVFNLTQAANSVGLVKNLVLTSNPTFTELSQGVKNTMVMSVMTGNEVTAQGELYEFTAQNLAYLAQLNGATFDTATNIETTIPLAGTGSPGSPATVIAVTSATGFAVGDWILIQNPNVDDDTIARKITAIATNNITVSPAITRTTAANSVVRRVNLIAVGTKTDAPMFSAVVHGQLASGEEVSYVLPRVRITSGLNLAFQSSDFGNMPIEIKAYDLTPTDTGYTELGPVSGAILT